MLVLLGIFSGQEEEYKDQSGECFMKIPATSPDSASGRSKGVRLVSARSAIKKIVNMVEVVLRTKHLVGSQ